MVEAMVRAIAKGFEDPSMRGPNFTWLGSFPHLGVVFARGQFDLGYCKIHPHHLEELKQKAQEIALEYDSKEKSGA